MDCNQMNKIRIDAIANSLPCMVEKEVYFITQKHIFKQFIYIFFINKILIIFFFQQKKIITCFNMETQEKNQKRKADFARDHLELLNPAILYTKRRSCIACIGYVYESSTRIKVIKTMFYLTEP